MKMSETLFTTKIVADRLGISTGLVRRLAREMNLGQWVGELRVYTEADIEAMRRRNTQPGRPRKDATT